MRTKASAQAVQSLWISDSFMFPAVEGSRPVFVLVLRIESGSERNLQRGTT